MTPLDAIRAGVGSAEDWTALVIVVGVALLLIGYGIVRYARSRRGRS